MLSPSRASRPPGLSELQLAGLGTAKDAGTALFGAVAGFAFDAAPAWKTVAASAAVNVAGFSAIWCGRERTHRTRAGTVPDC